MGKGDGLLNDLFDDLLHCYDVVNTFLNSNNFFYNSWHLFYHLLYVRNNLLDFFYLFFYQYPLHNLFNFMNFDHCFNHWNDFFHNLKSRNDSLYDFLFRNYFLNWNLDRNWYLERNDNVLLYFNCFHTLVSKRHNLLNSYLPGNLLNNVNRHLS